LYFRYQYDAVGREALPSETREHRLSESKLLGTEVPEIVNQYQYDETNRLISKNGTNYTWDANGNLLSDGESVYTYDSANRLVSVAQNGSISNYAYNGLGDRVLQTINGLTTNYVLDLNTGLTQVLQDGTNTYLYRINRVAQSTAEQSEFFLADALGSVRTLSTPLAEITLTQSYTPFGEVLNTSGAGQTDYAFTREMYDSNTGLVFLRARYYNPSIGRFTSCDPWEGDERMPMSYNAWLYVYENPIILVDPSGNTPDDNFCDRYPEDFSCIYYGITPNANGLNWVKDHKKLFGETPEKRDIYVAAGMAIQSQWMSFVDSRWFVDCVMGGIRYIFKLDGSSGIGPAQIDDDEMAALFKDDWKIMKAFGLDQENPRVAIEAMRRRIYRQINACTNCTIKDKYIIAAIAQNSYEFVFEGDLDIYKNKENTDKFYYDWEEFFNKLKPKGNNLDRRAGGHNNYDSRFMLKLFTNDIKDLVKNGWLLPSGITNMDLIEFDELSYGEYVP